MLTIQIPPVLNQTFITILSIWKHKTFPYINIFPSFYPCILNFCFVYFTSLDFIVIDTDISSRSLKGALFTHARQLMQTSHIWTAEQCAKYWHTNTCTPFMERSHTRIFWFYLAALLPSHAPLCQPAAHTALQLWFYIPVRQNDSLVHNVSQIRRF